MATIQDVAKAAGVSPMTVSNVINAHPHVAPATREKVLRAIDEIGYRVNVAARRLRTGRTGTIGLAIPDIESPYFTHLVAEVVGTARTHGYRVAIEQTDAVRESELEAVASSRNHLYDGLVLSTVGMSADDAARLGSDFPIVLLGEHTFHAPVDHIALPNHDGSREAVEHLVQTGRRRIALFNLAPTDEEGHDRRRHGYTEALTSAGLPVDPALHFVVDDFSMESGVTAARAAVASGIEFDAAFCVTDGVALGVMRGLADAGVRVPDDVAVVGFDDIVEGQYSIPRLSTVAPDHHWTAATAVQFLLERIRGDGPEEAREVVSPHRLVVRESSGS